MTGHAFQSSVRVRRTTSRSRSPRLHASSAAASKNVISETRRRGVVLERNGRGDVRCVRARCARQRLRQCEGWLGRRERREQERYCGGWRAAQTAHDARNRRGSLSLVHRALDVSVCSVRCRGVSGVRGVRRSAVVDAAMHRAEAVRTTAILGCVHRCRLFGTASHGNKRRQHRRLAQQPDDRKRTKVMSDCRHGPKVRQV